MNHDEDAHPGDDPEENHDGDHHDGPDDDGGTTPDGASDAEGSEDDSDESGHTRMTLDEIKQRAEERYGDLSPEEAEAQSLADLKNTWSQVFPNVGPDLRGISNITDAISRDLGRSITPSMMPQMPQLRLTAALSQSARNPLMDAFKDVMPSGPFAGIDMSPFKTFRDISRMMPSGLSVPDIDPEPGTDEAPHDPEDGALTLSASPDESAREAQRLARDKPEKVQEYLVAYYAHSATSQALTLQSIEQQSDDLRTILATMREQTESVHETAQAMKTQLEQTKVQLEQMEEAAAEQRTQHDDAMAANHRSIAISRWSVIVAVGALVASLVIGYFQLNQPVEVEWQGPPSSSTPGTSSGGATSPPQ